VILYARVGNPLRKIQKKKARFKKNQKYLLTNPKTWLEPIRSLNIFFMRRRRIDGNFKRTGNTTSGFEFDVVTPRLLEKVEERLSVKPVVTFTKNPET
jgi:hypothetical protein